MEKEGEGFREAREAAVGAIARISYQGGAEVKKGLFKHEGLIDGLIEIAGETGNEDEDARQWAVWAMNNIADGDDEVKAGMFHFPGLMTCIEGILLDATLNGTHTKGYATMLASKLLTWQHSSFRATFETYTLMLKLCSKKHRRADPNPTSRLAVFFFESEDVWRHTLSFLESKRSHLNHAIRRANKGEIIWK